MIVSRESCNDHSRYGSITVRVTVVWAVMVD